MEYLWCIFALAHKQALWSPSHLNAQYFKGPRSQCWNMHANKFWSSYMLGHCFLQAQCHLRRLTKPWKLLRFDRQIRSSQVGMNKSILTEFGRKFGKPLPRSLAEPIERFSQLAYFTCSTGGKTEGACVYTLPLRDRHVGRRCWHPFDASSFL